MHKSYIWKKKTKLEGDLFAGAQLQDAGRGRLGQALEVGLLVAGVEDFFCFSATQLQLFFSCSQVPGQAFWAFSVGGSFMQFSNSLGLNNKKAIRKRNRLF